MTSNSIVGCGAFAAFVVDAIVRAAEMITSHVVVALVAIVIVVTIGVLVLEWTRRAGRAGKQAGDGNDRKLRPVAADTGTSRRRRPIERCGPPAKPHTMMQDLNETVLLTSDDDAETLECNAKLVRHARVTQFPCKRGHYHDFDHRGSNAFSARGRCVICHMLFTYHMETSRLRVWRPLYHID